MNEGFPLPSSIVPEEGVSRQLEKVEAGEYRGEVSKWFNGRSDEYRGLLEDSHIQIDKQMRTRGADEDTALDEAFNSLYSTSRKAMAQRLTGNNRAEHRFADHATRTFLGVPEVVRAHYELSNIRTTLGNLSAEGRPVPDEVTKRFRELKLQAARWSGDAISTVMADQTLRAGAVNSLGDSLRQTFTMFNREDSEAGVDSQTASIMKGIMAPALAGLALKEEGIVHVASPEWDVDGNIDMVYFPNSRIIDQKATEAKLIQIKGSVGRDADFLRGSNFRFQAFDSPSLNRYMNNERNGGRFQRMSSQNWSRTLSGQRKSFRAMEGYAQSVKETFPEWKNVDMDPYFCYTYMTERLSAGKDRLRNAEVSVFEQEEGD